MGKPTIGSSLQKIIKDNLVIVTEVQVHNKDTFENRNMNPDQFLTDFDFYMESGIFAESVDFKYVKTGSDSIEVEIGYMSSYCINCIKVILRLCYGVTMEQVEKQLSETIFNILSA